jgi:hypothetical protein
LVHAEWRYATGDIASAEADLAKAKGASAQIGNEPFLARADFQLANLARGQGDLPEAEDLHHRAMTLSVRHRLGPAVAQSLEAFAGIAVSQEGTTEATRLFAAAAAIRNTIGLPRPPAEQLACDIDLDLARRRLGESAFSAVWEEGVAMTIDDPSARRAQTPLDRLGQPHSHRTGCRKTYRQRTQQP